MHSPEKDTGIGPLARGLVAGTCAQNVDDAGDDVNGTLSVCCLCRRPPPQPFPFPFPFQGEGKMISTLVPPPERGRMSVNVQSSCFRYWANFDALAAARAGIGHPVGARAQSGFETRNRCLEGRLGHAAVPSISPDAIVVRANRPRAETYKCEQRTVSPTPIEARSKEGLLKGLPGRCKTRFFLRMPGVSRH